MHATLHRYTAFSRDPRGGNPAGVWVGDLLPDAPTMQRIATGVGFSETAFLASAGDGRWQVRYFSPQAEVPFCGHASIAAGVVLGDTFGDGDHVFETTVGEVPVTVTRRGGVREASLVSVAPTHVAAAPEDVGTYLALLGWTVADLDPAIPPARIHAGAWHLLLAARERRRLASLDYPFGPMRARMLADGLTTLQLVWREDVDTFHARNPFPVGGVFEDPATGAAAAALGGYLRDSGALHAPARVSVHQGEAMGRPSVIAVDVPARGGIVVSGSAVPWAG